MRAASSSARRNGPTLRCPPSEAPIERHVVFPLANLLATGQVQAGDMLCIDWDPRVEACVLERRRSGRSQQRHTLLVSTQTRKAAGAAAGAAEVPLPPRREVLKQ